MLRACLNFPIKYFYPPLFEFVSGLFPRFHSSDGPLVKTEKHPRIQVSIAGRAKFKQALILLLFSLYVLPKKKPISYFASGVFFTDSISLYCFPSFNTLMAFSKSSSSFRRSIAAPR